MVFKAKLNNYRSSTKKIGDLLNSLVGLTVGEARNFLIYCKKGASADLYKLIKSGFDNVKNTTKNKTISENEVFISLFVAQQGKSLKRWMPKAHGRATRIIRRTCNLVLELEFFSEEEKENLEKVINGLKSGSNLKEENIN